MKRVFATGAVMAGLLATAPLSAAQAQSPNENAPFCTPNSEALLCTVVPPPKGACIVGHGVVFLAESAVCEHRRPAQ